MRDFQVGGRKEMGIRDHLFIIYCIIHEHSKSKTRPVTIQIMDYRCCFDSLWQNEVTIELVEAEVDDNKLALLHKINKINHIRVKTLAGLFDA